MLFVERGFLNILVFFLDDVHVLESDPLCGMEAVFHVYACAFGIPLVHLHVDF
jgi:hypothetical protein